jgi:hypothetical protein
LLGYYYLPGVFSESQDETGPNPWSGVRWFLRYYVFLLLLNLALAVKESDVTDD